MWYRWESRAQFDAWHQQVVDGLGLPRTGVNALTHEPQPDKQPTISYTQVSEVEPDDWRAFVEPQVAAQFPDGLGAPSSAPDVGLLVVDGVIVPPPAPEPDPDAPVIDEGVL